MQPHTPMVRVPSQCWFFTRIFLPVFLSIFSWMYTTAGLFYQPNEKGASGSFFWYKLICELVDKCIPGGEWVRVFPPPGFGALAVPKKNRFPQQPALEKTQCFICFCRFVFFLKKKHLKPRFFAIFFEAFGKYFLTFVLCFALGSQRGGQALFLRQKKSKICGHFKAFFQAF